MHLNIPESLRHLTDGQRCVDFECDNLAHFIRQFSECHPQLSETFFPEGELSPHINLFYENQSIVPQLQRKQSMPLPESAMVYILSSIPGG